MFAVASVLVHRILSPKLAPPPFLILTNLNWYLLEWPVKCIQLKDIIPLTRDGGSVQNWVIGSSQWPGWTFSSAMFENTFIYHYPEPLGSCGMSRSAVYSRFISVPWNTDRIFPINYLDNIVQVQFFFQTPRIQHVGVFSCKSIFFLCVAFQHFYLKISKFLFYRAPAELRKPSSGINFIFGVKMRTSCSSKGNRRAPQYLKSALRIKRTSFCHFFFFLHHRLLLKVARQCVKIK